MEPQPKPLEAAVFPIGAVADLTGVNAITLRAWERRYGLFQPLRKTSRHRLYTQQHIDLINRVVALLDRGMRIGQVRAHLESERMRQEQHGAPPQDRWQRYLERMIGGVMRFDEMALENAYNEALAVYPVQTVTEELLTPLLTELGRRWADGEGSVAEEHFFGCYLRNKLGARFHHRVRKPGGRKLLLACLPGDRHETGLLLFALAASDAGYQPVLLGADLPLGELPVAARKTGSAAVVLSGSIAPDGDLLREQLPVVVRECGVPVFVGGTAAIQARQALRDAGAEPLGVDVGAGLLRIGRALDARH